MRKTEQAPEALVALGGNLGGEQVIAERFRAAGLALAEQLGSEPARLSRIYRSKPVGPISEQPLFLNAAVAIPLRAPAEPQAILETVLRVEAGLGRVRATAVPQGPRTIDLDLLFVGDQVVSTPGPPPLTLPHPRIAARAFVLRPLADLCGLAWVMPGIGRSIGDCLADPEVAQQDAELELYHAE